MTSTAPRFGWFGDDFTGATDTLAVLAQAGLRSMLFMGVPSAEALTAAGPLDAVGIAGAARAMPPDAMQAELAPVGRFFRQIAPTVLADVSPDSPVMSEEIFGPVLPVLAYESLDEAVAFVNARPKPLALYLFTTDKAAERRVLRDCSFGGGCINDTIIHLATSDMGFGGVGESGMGSYHGKLSFDTFTHYKSIVKKSNRLDLPVRYQPYTKEKERMLRRVLK